ncbi:ABC transporter ATP-binding protein [Polynucleobacter paneuropaeus]|nr:ABC transporter ATP-binding protein [Polynucleobacter paneuropaeus]
MLIIFSSLCEMISIGSMVPFLLVVSNPEVLFSNTYTRLMVEHLPFSDPRKIIYFFTIVFISLVMISAFIRGLLNWAQIRVSYGIGIDLGVESYRRTLYQQYQTHISRNSSEVILGITQYTRSVTTGVIMPVLVSLSAIFLLVAIAVVLVTIDPWLTLVTGAFLSAIYMMLSLVIKGKLTRLSHLVKKNDIETANILQQSFGGIRDIIVDGTQDFFCDLYRQHQIIMAQTETAFSVMAMLPRYGVEAFTLCLFAVVSVFLTKEQDGFLQALPALGAIALGAQRLLPLLQQLYANWTSIKAHEPRLMESLDLLEQPLPTWISQKANASGEVGFNQNIEIENLSFKYEYSEKPVLTNLNYSIKIGSRVGIIGKTGSGKSTLVDILMGLLVPTLGALKVDGKLITLTNCRAWQNRIAHVPQAIFLADASIMENIAFGVGRSSICVQRVISAAKMAQLEETIETLPEGLETCVGERGVRLSGGQRQRIGIARALYKKAEVIIFDEATSALDDMTEKSVIDSIRSLPDTVTVIMIAHRISTLIDCSEIIEITDGKIKRHDNYSSIYKLKNQFSSDI